MTLARGAAVSLRELGDPALRRPFAGRRRVGLHNIQDALAALHNALRAVDVGKGALGISAPQIGSDLRFFLMASPKRFARVIAGGGDDPEDKRPIPIFGAGNVFKYAAIINPRIVSRSSSTSAIIEECLSVPGLRCEVRRSEVIRARFSCMVPQPLCDEDDDDDDAQQYKLNSYDAVFKGPAAALFQHEHDHLKGRLILDIANTVTMSSLAGGSGDGDDEEEAASAAMIAHFFEMNR